jgi:hypothetical protein
MIGGESQGRGNECPVLIAPQIFLFFFIFLFISSGKMPRLRFRAPG